MKKVFIVIMATIFLSHFPYKSIQAQNLIKNGSFEEKAYCPSNFNQQKLRILNHWTQPNTATPDYFNRCSDLAGVPNNTFGEQEALDGDAYAGLVTYADSQRNYREYLQQKLIRPLTKGELICVEFWVSSGDKSAYVSDGFGAHFSKSPLQSNRKTLFEVRPQVQNPNLHMLDDQNQWVKISDTFRAEGGERYITIGSFKSDGIHYLIKRTKANAEMSASTWAYLYVDDVVVKPVNKRSDCSCQNDLIKAELTDPPVQLSAFKTIENKVVYFEFDDSTLTEEGRLVLDDAAYQLRNHAFMFVEVNGHADVMGREGYNVELSKNRAIAVVKYLKEKGVDPNRLHIRYHGSAVPAEKLNTAEARARNRRVEFAILESLFMKVETP